MPQFKFLHLFQLKIIGAVVTVILAVGIGIIIGHFAISKTTNTSSKYDHLTRQTDPKNYQKFIDSIQATRIEENLK